MNFDNWCLQNQLRPIDKKALRPVWDKIKHHMDWDDGKTALWFETKNPLLGDIEPLHLIKLNRLHKLLKFINNLIEENYI